MVSVIVAFPALENGKRIKNILVQHGFHINAVCTAGAQVLQHADRSDRGVVVCAATHYLPACFEMLVLAGPGSWEEPMEHTVYLPMPLKVYELVNTLEMTVQSMAVARQRRKSRPGQRSQEENQAIRQAKELLMAQKQMTEGEAHRYIQKSSMDSGTGLGETAQMILSMFR